MKLLIYLSFLFLLLYSCETNKHIRITAYNALSNEPVDSVLVKINAGKNGDYNKSTSQGYTDKDGNFETYLMIGCAFGCYDIYIEYSKINFKTKVELNQTEGKIFLYPE